MDVLFFFYKITLDRLTMFIANDILYMLVMNINNLSHIWSEE